MIEVASLMLMKASEFSSWNTNSEWIRTCAIHLCVCCKRIRRRDVRELRHTNIMNIWRHLRHALRRSMPEAAAARFHEPARMALIKQAIRSDSLPSRLAGQLALNQLIQTVGHAPEASYRAALPAGAQLQNRHIRRGPKGAYLVKEAAAWLDPTRLAGWLRGLDVVRDAFELRRHNSLWDQAGHAMSWLAAHGQLPDTQLALVWQVASTAGTKVGLGETAWQALNAVAAYALPRQRKLLLGWLMVLPQESWCSGALGLLRCLAGDLKPADKWCRLAGMDAGEAEQAWFKVLPLQSGALFPDGQPDEPSFEASAGAGASDGEGAAAPKPSEAELVKLEGWDPSELQGAELAAKAIMPLTIETTEGDIEAGARAVSYFSPDAVDIDAGSDDAECARVRCAALQIMLACASPVSLAAWRARVLAAGVTAAKDATTWAVEEGAEGDRVTDLSRVRICAWLAGAVEAASRCSGVANGEAAASGGSAFAAAEEAAKQLGSQANDMLPTEVSESARSHAESVIVRTHLGPVLPGIARDAWAALSNGYATNSMRKVFIACVDAIRLLQPVVKDEDGNVVMSEQDDADRLLLDLLGDGKIATVWLQELANFREDARKCTSLRSAALDTALVDEPAEPPAPLLGCRPPVGSPDPASATTRRVKAASSEATSYSSGITRPGCYLAGVASRMALLGGCLQKCGPLLLQPSDVDAMWELLATEGSTPGERARLLEWFANCISSLFREETIHVHAQRELAMVMKESVEDAAGAGDSDKKSKNKKKNKLAPLGKMDPEERVRIESEFLGTDRRGSSAAVAAKLRSKGGYPLVFGECIVRLLTEHLEGPWVSDDPSDLCDEDDASGLRKRWKEPMSFLWLQLQACLNRAFLYVNHYEGRLHCSANSFTVQKVGEHDSGLVGEGAFWRIALGGQDETASTHAAEKLASLLHQLQGDAKKQRANMMAGYLKRAVAAIRTAVARARLEVPPEAATSLRRLPSIGDMPRASSTGSIIDGAASGAGSGAGTDEDDQPAEADFT